MPTIGLMSETTQLWFKLQCKYLNMIILSYCDILSWSYLKLQGVMPLSNSHYYKDVKNNKSHAETNSASYNWSSRLDFNKTIPIFVYEGWKSKAK